jgi:hypothetical protein
VEVLVSDKPREVPKLVAASIKVQVVLNQKEKKNEVVALSCVVHDSGIVSAIFHLFTVIIITVTIVKSINGYFLSFKKKNHDPFDHNAILIDKNQPTYL